MYNNVYNYVEVSWEEAIIYIIPNMITKVPLRLAVVLRLLLPLRSIDSDQKRLSLPLWVDILGVSVKDASIFELDVYSRV